MTINFWIQSSVLAALPIIGQAFPGTGTEFIQYGALGLATFMVWQNYKQADKLGKIIDAQREELKESNGRLRELHVETLNTIRKCAAPSSDNADQK